MGGQPRRSRDEPTAVAARDVVARPPSRVIIEDVTPQVDGGRFAAKRAVGETVDVGATIFADGHDLLSARIRWRRAGEPGWHDAPMDAARQRRWTARFVVETLGRYEFTVEAWIDRFGTWRHGFARKVEAGQDVASELLEGAALVRAAAARAGGTDGAWLGERADVLGGTAAAADPRRRGARGGPARDDGAPSGSRRGGRPRPAARRRGRARACGLRRVVRDAFRAPCRPSRRGPARCATSRTACRTSPAWASTCSTCRRSIRSARRTARAATTRSAASRATPGSPWAIGVARRRPHRRPSRARHARRLRRAGRARARARPRDRARHRLPVLARSSVGDASIPSGSGAGPTASIQYAENPPRSTRTSTRSTSSPAAWRALWEALRDVVLFWIGARRDASSASTTRTPSRFAFWEWLIARGAARGIPRSSSSPRRSRGRR